MLQHTAASVRGARRHVLIQLMDVTATPLVAATRVVVQATVPVGNNVVAQVAAVAVGAVAT